MKYEYINNLNITKLALIGLAYILIFAVAFFVISKFEKEDKSISLKKKGFIVFCSFMAVGIVIRLAFAMFSRAHADVTSFFIPWTNSLMENPLSEFYFLNGDVTQINAFHDYTPLYMYVLYIIGFFVKTFNFGNGGMIFLQRIPACICDIIATWYIFKTARHICKKDFFAYAIALFYFLCPAVIVDSSMWGQVDGITSMFFIIVFYHMVKGNDLLAIFFSIVGMCFKLQFVFVAPAIGVYYLFKWFKDKKCFYNCLKGLGIGVLFFVIVNLPFTYKIVFGGNPLFPLDIYMRQVGSYSYYTLNSFNLYGALNLNFAPLPEDYTTSMINMLTIAIPCVLAVAYFAVKRDLKSVPILASFVISAVFMFSFKMHERYMFGAIIALVVTLAFKFDWLLFIATALNALTNYLNIAILMAIPSLTFEYVDARIVAGGILGLVSFGFLVAYMIKTLFEKKTLVLQETPLIQEQIQTEI